MTVRPTLRCLRDDLHLPLPSARVPLDEIDHPVLRKAAEQFAARDTPHERITSVDDVVLFKVKTGRWRGASFPTSPATTHRTGSSPPASAKKGRQAQSEGNLGGT